MDHIAKYSTANKLIQHMRYELNRSKQDSHGEVGDMYKKLISWMEDSQTLFSNTINSNAERMNKGLNALAEEFCGLETKLSVITQERDDLLKTINNLSDEIRQWSTKLLTKGSLPEPDGSLNQNIDDCPAKGISNSKVQGSCSGGADQEEHKDSAGSIDQLVQQHLQTSLADQSDQNHLSLSDSDNIDLEHENNKEHMDKIEEVTGTDDIGETDKREKEPVEKSISEALCSSPYKSSRSQYLICQVCTIAFSKTQDLRTHFKNVHSISLTIKDSESEGHLKQPTIPLDKKEDKWSAPQKHNISVQTKEVYDKRRNYGCEECSYTTNLKSSLNRHWDAVHNLGDKKFKCEICPYTSAQRNYVRYHMASVHNFGETLRCDKCPYSSANKNTLKRHTEMKHEKLNRSHI